MKVYTITKINGNSIYLDELKKPYRDFDLVVAVESNDDETNKKVENYNKNVDINKKEDRIKRRLASEGLNSYLTAGKYYK